MANAAILDALPIIERRTLGDSAYLHLRELLMSGPVSYTHLTLPTILRV